LVDANIHYAQFVEKRHRAGDILSIYHVHEPHSDGNSEAGGPPDIVQCPGLTAAMAGDLIVRSFMQGVKAGRERNSMILEELPLRLLDVCQVCVYFNP